MKGVILGLDTEKANVVILGCDDKRYNLQKSEWKSMCEPSIGMEVDFLTDGDNLAQEAYYIQKVITHTSTKPKATYLWETLPLLVKCAGVTSVCGICIFLAVKFYNAFEHRNGELSMSQSDGQETSNGDVTKNALYDKGFADGKEAGYLLGIDDARHNIKQGESMIRTISKFSVQKTNELLRGQGRPLVSEEEANGIVEGYVQGYAEGQRKVFVDGQ